MSGTAGALHRAAVAKLQAAGIENAPLDARVLLAHVLGLDAVQLISDSSGPVPEALRERFERFVERRAAGEPVARIVGAKEFWSRSFSLSPQTLVPRPETETVVEAALDAKSDRVAPLRILDLGTGSGILLAALLLERPKASGVGVDLDPEAARTARGNLVSLGLGDRAHIVCGNWAEAIEGRFDLVVSNPPYIATGDLAGLAVEVRTHDPRLALDGGSDGMNAYRVVVAALGRLLAPGGVAVFELGKDQEPAVVGLARNAQIQVKGPARCDLSGHPRALILGL